MTEQLRWQLTIVWVITLLVLLAIALLQIPWDAALVVVIILGWIFGWIAVFWKHPTALENLANYVEGTPNIFFSFIITIGIVVPTCMTVMVICLPLVFRNDKF